MSAGVPSYDAVLAEAGLADFADRLRLVPEVDRDYSALCELSVAVQRIAARIEVIGATIAIEATARTPRRSRRSFRTRNC